MPIAPSREIRAFSQEEFHEVDHRAMGVVFNIHNEFGRFLDESLYRRAIAARCEELRIVPAEEEVGVRVTHGSFCKDYFMDLLLCRGVMFELKAVEALAPAHRAQALNYLFLTGSQHGKLVNLRPERVQHEFVSTGLTDERRREFSVFDTSWKDVNTESAWLRSKVVDLLRDWGAFLEVALYRDAITHFIGGPEKVVTPVEISSSRGVLGEQDVHLLAPDTAFAISAVTDRIDATRQHQLGFLRHSALRHIQWINMNRHRIEFTTLSK